MFQVVDKHNLHCRFSSPLERHSWLVLAEGLLDTTRNELVKHLESGLWLGHWDHVACIEHSEELEVLVSLEGTSGFGSDSPLLVFLLMEVGLACPRALAH